MRSQGWLQMLGALSLLAGCAGTGRLTCPSGERFDLRLAGDLHYLPAEPRDGVAPAGQLVSGDRVIAVVGLKAPPLSSGFFVSGYDRKVGLTPDGMTVWSAAMPGGPTQYRSIYVIGREHSSSPLYSPDACLLGAYFEPAATEADRKSVIDSLLLTRHEGGAPP